MLMGNIGTGKSLFANRYAKEKYSIVNMDSLQASIGGGSYSLYDKNKRPIYSKVEEEIITGSLKQGISVCIDRTCMDKKTRKRYIDLINPLGVPIECVNFGKGNEISLKRRINNNRGVPTQRWESVHQFMAERYEPPMLLEGFEKIIQPPEKYEFHAFDFDGTIVKNNFPEIGELIDGTIRKMNDLFQDVKNVIIIWSNRSGNYENHMRQFLLENKIPFDFINENPMFETGSRKVFAHKYYDDRNIT